MVLLDFYTDVIVHRCWKCRCPSEVLPSTAAAATAAATDAQQTEVHSNSRHSKYSRSGLLDDTRSMVNKMLIVVD